MTLTKKNQQNHIMSIAEKKAYIKIIKKMPHLYFPILTEIKKIAPKAKTLTDIACGNGFLLEKIHKLFHQLKLSGIDADGFMIKNAKESFLSNFKLQKVENFTDKADIIIVNLSLHHFKNPKTILKKLYKLSNIALLVSDQIRPLTKMDLEKRLERRKRMIGKCDEPFYKKNEKASILEAYSKKEIIDIFNCLKIKYKIRIFDKDYYERFVAILMRTK